MSRCTANTCFFAAPKTETPFFAKKGAESFFSHTAQAFFEPTKAKAAQMAPVKSEYKNEADIKLLTLSNFYTYTHQQADWAIRTPDADLPQAVRANLRKLQSFAEEKRILDACGDMSVNDVMTAGGTLDDIFKHLRKYKQGYTQKLPTVELAAITDVKKAIEYAKAILKLETVLSGAVLSVTLKEKEGKWKDQLTRLIDKKWIDDLVSYIQNCHASIEANNGRDFESYIEMRQETTNPSDYKGKLANVKNFHRFEPDALNKLVENESKGNPITGWGPFKSAKPFVLILHSGLDHNGAFHRDKFLTEVIKHVKNFTLMVEGASSIGDMTSLIAPMSKQYGGTKGKINQVMLAGHGNSKSMQLAGTTSQDVEDGAVKTDTKRVTARDTDNDSKLLMETLFKNMANDANSRIVLNACLTASDSVPGELDPDPAKAKKQINDAINNNPSLATKFKQVAAAEKSKVTVAGANGSFGQIQLIDPKTGQLDLIPTKSPDPALTSEPIEYVRSGTEPVGVLRATVKCWAEDQAKCMKAVQDHYDASAGANYDSRLIKTIFGIILKSPNDGRLMNQLSHATDTMAEFSHSNEVNNIDELIAVRGLIGNHLDTIYKDILPLLSDQKKMLLYQEWMLKDNAKDNDFLTALDIFATANEVQRFVNITSIAGSLARLLPLPAAAPNKNAKIKLAALGVMKGNNNPGDASYEFLHSLVIDRKFPAALNIATLTGFSEQTLLENIGITEDVAPEPPKKGGKKTPAPQPTPNIDLNGDGKHDFYINTFAGGAFITADLLNVRYKPGKGYSIIATVKKGEVVVVIGDSGDWYAIQYKKRIGFIHKNYSTLQPVS